MKRSAFNYLRSYRKRHALSSGELATLIGLNSGSTIGLLERGERSPSLSVALALQVVFGAAPRELFPGLYEGVEDTVMRRASQLYEAIEGEEDSRSEAMRHLIEEMPRRSLANRDIT